MSEIQATFNPRVGSVSDLFEISFSSPAEADRVTITLSETNAWGRGAARVTEGRGSQRIAVFTGTITGGIFQGTVSQPSPLPNPQAGQLTLRVTFAGDSSTTVHTLPIPPTAQANENGIFEISLRVTARVEIREGGRVNRQTKRFTMPQPLFLRNFRSGRPVGAFVTGSGGGFFAAANQFWQRHADGNFSHNNVLSIREFLRTQADARGYGPWAEVNIVSHGNAVEWVIQLQSSDRRPRHLRWWDIERARSDPSLSGNITSQLDAQSTIVIRGCAIGNDQRLLDEIRQLFGGQVTVKAPKYLQCYHASSGSPPRESFYEYFFFYAKQQSAPDDATCASRLAAKYPSSGINNDDWLRMLGNRAQYPPTPTGFRATYRPETITWEQTETVTGIPRNQAQQEMRDYDWRGEAESSFDYAEPHENRETTFNDWHWVEGAVQQRSGGTNVTIFTRSFTGHRIRIEVRRELCDADGNPVQPDMNNSSHYGVSSP